MKVLRQYQQKVDRLQIDCPVRAALDVIQGRWKPSLLYELKQGPRRFTQLQEALSGISAQALTVQLRQLEADGVVERVVYPQVPSRVEYTLTEMGRTLAGVMDELEAWGIAYLERRNGAAGKRDA